MSEDKEWKALQDSVYSEISRCVNHIQLGMFSADRSEALHAFVLRCLSKRVTQTDTHSFALSLRTDGLHLIINAHYFMETLASTKERCAALRHEEQHLFLRHPFRFADFPQQLQSNRLLENSETQNISWVPSLFSKLCDFECSHSIGGHAPIHDAATTSKYLHLPIPKAASAEQMYFLLYPYYVQMEKNSVRAPTFSGHPNQAVLCDLYELLTTPTHSDHQHWDGEQFYRSDASAGNKQKLNHIDYRLLKSEQERILVIARESLSSEERSEIPQHMSEEIDGFLAKRDCKSTDPETAQKAEKEINRVLNQFVLYEPFYAHFLLRCVRQVSDTIQTAGVALLKKYVLLLVNPDFFMNQLKDTGERGAVLLHEALHIMNKHIIQMHKDAYADKRLYNIAADLEINQLIGGRWTLPDGALSIHKPPFASLNLPEFDIAETYYKRLLEEKDKNSEGWKKIKPMTEQNTIGGHSDHDGWGSNNGERKESWLPMGSAKGGDVDAHEMDIERAVQEAAQSTKAGSVPAHFQKLLDQWKQDRAPAIDWKRELRIFLSFNPSTDMRRTYNKKSNRFIMRMRRSLSKTRVTTDVIFAFARHRPQDLPSIVWGEINQELQEELISIEPRFSSFEPNHTLALEGCLHLSVYTLLCKYPAAWPSWEDVPDKLLRLLKMIRVPIDPNVLPMDLIVTLSRQHPKLLPLLTWEDHFGAFEKKRIRKLYPFISQPAWGLLPSEEIIKVIIRNPEQFQIKTSDVPQDFLAQFSQYDFRGTQPFRIDRIIKCLSPGLKAKAKLPKLLIMVDESGSVGDDDLSYFFSEIDGIHEIGCEVYILKFDTEPALFHRYHRTHPKQRDASGGTMFDPPIAWLNEARTGAEINTKNQSGEQFLDTITMRFDGAIILTDGYASTPTIQPYCQVMWVITPDGSDEAIREAGQPYAILKLPPYEKR